MQLAVLQENLKNALAAVMPAVASKSTLPVLSTIRFTADEHRLTLTATNLELAITVQCGAKIDKPGAVCVPAKLLQELINGFPNDRIDLSLDKYTLTLRAGRYQTTIKCIEADEFPVIPVVTSRAELPLALLRQAASHVALAAEVNGTRPVLGGVHVVLNGVARYEAADGYRLAQLDQALEGSIDPMIDVIIPAKALATVAKAFKGQEDAPVRIGTSQSGGDAFGPASQLLFDVGNVQVVTRLIDGKFPDMERVIPTSYATRIIVEAREFKQALAIAEVYASQSSNIVKFQATSGGELAPGRLTLSANAAEVGDSQITLDGMIDGGDCAIALNVNYVAQALGCIDTPQVAIELKSPQAPAVFRPVGADGYLHIVMPMTVR